MNKTDKLMQRIIYCIPCFNFLQLLIQTKVFLSSIYVGLIVLQQNSEMTILGLDRSLVKVRWILNPAQIECPTTLLSVGSQNCRLI